MDRNTSCAKKTSTVLVNIKLSGVLIKKGTASVSLPTHKSQAFPLLESIPNKFSVSRCQFNLVSDEKRVWKV